MTSKGILEQLYIASKIGITSKENGKILKDYYKVVLQDLEKLEALTVNVNVAQSLAKKYKQENDKLKKVIEILKDKLDIKLEVYHSGGCTLNHKIIPNCIVSQERCLRHLEVEEYYLLKEVIHNEKGM